MDVVIAVIVTLVFSIPISAAVTSTYRKKVVESKIGNAEDKAREIIDEALKTAETKKREYSYKERIGQGDQRAEG